MTVSVMSQFTYDLNKSFFSRNAEQKVEQVRNALYDRLNEVTTDEQGNVKDCEEAEFLRSLLDVIERS